MGRLFAALFLTAAMVLPMRHAHDVYVQPVFFSMLFPQLIPEDLLEGREWKAVFL